MVFGSLCLVWRSVYEMMLLQVIVNAIIAGSLYALIALGFGLIYRSTKVFHFAHAAVYTASAYVLFVCVVFLGLPVLLAVSLAILFSVLFGWALERYIYYPLVVLRAPTGVLMVSSIGIYTASVNIIAAIFGNDGKMLFLRDSRSFNLGPLLLTGIQLSEVTISVLFCAAVLAFIKYSRTGRLIQAIVDNDALLNVLGIDARKIRLMTFGLGSALAATAACLVAFDVGIDPFNGMNMLLISAISIIIGGLNSFKGAIVGAFTLALLQNLTAYIFSTRWEQPIAFLLLVSFLLFKPTGILGSHQRLEES
jgi:branched-chain amino acid transport system permease protein